MKNYQNSDYALNKFSEGIVYKFSGKIVEVTLAAYLAENPGKTEQDFRELKKMSDAIYLDQVRAENTQTKKDVSIHGMEETRGFGSVPLDEQYMEMQDRRYAAEAIARLLEDGALTETQRRRFVLYFVNGLSLREIAELEGTSHIAIHKTIRYIAKKAKDFFADQG